MGDDASERAATDDEIAQMQRARARRVRRGRGRLHVEPARAARRARRPRRAEQPRRARRAGRARVGARASSAAGSIEFIPRTFLNGYDDDDRALVRAMRTRVGPPGAPQHADAAPARARRVERAASSSREPRTPTGSRSIRCSRRNRQGAHFALDSTFLFDEMPSFRDTLTLPEPRAIAAPARSGAARRRCARRSPIRRGRSFVFVWQVLRVETVERPEHERYLDRTVHRDRRGAGRGSARRVPRPLARRRSRARSSCSRAPPNPKRRAATEALIRSPIVMAGSSDGGAHLLSFCGADYTTRLLTRVGPDVLTIEAGGRPPHVDPGRRVRDHRSRHARARARRPTCCSSTATRLGAPETPRYVRDFPADSGRYVVDATGYQR